MSLLEQINVGEGKKLEFKREFPPSEGLVKTICAFANTGGGKLLIGVDDGRQIVGVPGERIYLEMDKISNALHDCLHPAIVPDIYTYTIEQKTIVVVEVFPSPLRPHFLKSKGKSGGTYIRVGATNKKADAEYIQELERQRQNISYDSLASYRPAEDKDVAALLTLLDFRLDRTVTPTDLENLGLIQKMKQEIRLTNGAMLLLGASDKTRIQCARFKGKTTDLFIDKKTIAGDLFTQIEEAMKFLLFNINLSGKEGEDFLTRRDVYEIPPEALREALVNAVVHRDYAAMNSDVKIAVFDDRLEITSPGAFPGGITVEEAISGRSEIRNRVLARIFNEANFIEQWGRGIHRIFTLCADAGLAPPKIFESGMFVQVCIFRDRTKKPDEKTGRKNRTKKPDEKTGRNQKDYYRLIQAAFPQNQSFSSKEFLAVSRLGKSRGTEVLSELVAQGLLLKEGASRATRYRSKDQ